MFSWFRLDPKKKLRRAYEAKMAEAHAALQKYGDRALHAELVSEAEALADALEALDQRGPAPA